MTPDQWKHAKSIFERALNVPPEQQAQFLDSTCADDEELRALVVGMLAADADPPSVLEVEHSDLSTLMPDAQALPEHIGPYRILRMLGHGGMGVVLMAERTDLPKKVALKLLRDRWASPDVMQRFKFEQAVLARLQHPNIAQLLDAGTTHDGVPYFAMEYIEGESLTTFCDAQQLTLDERLRLFSKVCEAVQYAHRNLVIHRDLKPGNILIDHSGQIKLLDFGIAKLVETETELALTQTGYRAMTPAYASPEQILGRSVTTSSDVYSLGVVLYELLTGHRPYDAQSPGEWEQLVCEAEPSKPSTAVSRIHDMTLPDGTTAIRTPAQVSQARNTAPDQLKSRLRGDLDNIVLKALRKAPDQRYASAEAFLADVQRYLNGFPVEAHGDALGYRARKFIRRHKLGVGLTAGIATLILGFAGLMAWQQSVTAQERDRARLEADKANKVADFMYEFFGATFPKDLSTDTLNAGDLLASGLETVEEKLTDQPDVQAHMLNVIGRVYQSRGDYDTAHELLTRSLDLRRTVYEAPHAEIATALNALGMHYNIRGENEKAQAFHEEALAMRQTLYGNDHPDVALSLNNLASLSNARGDHDETLRLLNESLEIRKKHLGDEHADIAQSIGNLAVVYGSKGNTEKAVEMTREALAIRIKLFSEDHYDVVFTKGNLVYYLRQDGQLEEALALSQKVVDGFETLLGEDHPTVGKALMNQGLVLNALGRHDEAAIQYQNALPLLVKKAPDHWDVANTHRHLGTSYRKLGQLDKALPHLKKALALILGRYGENARYTGLAKSALGAYYTDAGDFAQAERYLNEALAILTNARGANNPATQRIQAQLDTLKVRMAAPFPLTMSRSRYDITALLHAASQNDEDAFNALYAQVYEELRRLARTVRSNRGVYTLNTTALVHEAYIKLMDSNKPDWKNRLHFFRIAARAMRQVLINAAIHRQAAKRGGGQVTIQFNEQEHASLVTPESILSLEDALQQLEQFDPDQAQIVECRFFAGLTIEETAQVLDTSPSKVKREWRTARAWLGQVLKADA